MKLRINVTARDIQQAKQARKKPGYIVWAMCPIARAVRRHGSSAITCYRVYIYGAIYDLPSKARQFIRRFDERKRAVPFRFVLGPTTNLIGEGGAHLRRQGTLSIVVPLTG